MKTTRKVCVTKNDIPMMDHFAILSFGMMHIPGDERSRQHPGHGYPASDEPYTIYESFTDRNEWIEEIRKRALNKVIFVPIAVRVPEITIETTVKIN